MERRGRRRKREFGAVRIGTVIETGASSAVLPYFELELNAIDGDAGRRTNSLSLDESRTIRDLPAGRWRLRLCAGEKPNWFLDVWTRGIHEREVRVEDGATTDVRFEVSPGGVVAFLPTADVPPEGGVWAGLTIRPADEPRTRALDLRAHDPYEPRHGGANTARHGLQFVAMQPIAPGPHAFVVEADGYLPSRCEVTVETDRLVVAPVTLRRL